MSAQWPPKCPIRFGTSIAALDPGVSDVSVRFTDGSTARFDLVFGADGVHSTVRKLVFGPSQQFERFLGAYVAAFHLEKHPFDIGRALKLHEETDRVGAFYPLDAHRMDATYAFRHDEVRVASERRLDFVRQEFKGAGWILEQLLDQYQGSAPIFFDSMTQIVMPEWHRGRVALLGDACGCLTLLAGQGSHMAMAGAYVLSRELARHGGDYEAAFAGLSGFPQTGGGPAPGGRRPVRQSVHPLVAVAAVAAPPHHPADVQRPDLSARAALVRRAKRAGGLRDIENAAALGRSPC